jgi:hypothetical protein
MGHASYTREAWIKLNADRLQVIGKVLHHRVVVARIITGDSNNLV